MLMDLFFCFAREYATHFRRVLAVRLSNRFRLRTLVKYKLGIKLRAGFCFVSPLGHSASQVLSTESMEFSIAL
jgi:hypothetical protein